jgi:hypothetical protein
MKKRRRYVKPEVLEYDDSPLYRIKLITDPITGFQHVYPCGFDPMYDQECEECGKVFPLTGKHTCATV